MDKKSVHKQFQKPNSKVASKWATSSRY